MLGAAGALCCTLAGTALGSYLHDRKRARWRMLQAETEALTGMRLLLEQEKPAMGDLLRLSANYAATGYGADQVIRRLLAAADQLEKHPAEGLPAAYAAACRMLPAPWEKDEERCAMEWLMNQLGSGTAAMRQEAAAACLRRLKPVQEAAFTQADKGGRLCVQLGLLLGAMAGILLW